MQSEGKHIYVPLKIVPCAIIEHTDALSTLRSEFKLSLNPK
jgi:hypothetical protein